ncbi:tRNA (adenosine(37)-N6)-threonylcarbamoyltransferase complex ATPase subunit type 1 TsaE [Tamlana crocina]|uniref:tRNA threonylcarbamoyladenosine biosynthesis protein TsaE n=1 Tax=Tamlana crocina TaxID=393006 RepID=A0ABX1DDP6_9FLAO|nr:tRNA (adenosine(37)-N6)-threonylcarbamoyltransferase complex ATPase subunit type 1 TsaE [Tamlana crocina]NJX15138.1 tRNA (adenosine(37)-N6)-threonylcarbamoyltransferase complex ATPase subunit type 1 TsaE [Tamlana crocina]
MEIRYNLDEVEDVAKKVVTNLKSKTLLFYGSMGVGKTTLIKTIVKTLGSFEIASSPTFSIVNEYSLEDDKIYHFDLYRIKDLEEAYNFGIEDYLESNHWKLIEWPEKIETILFDTFDKIKLEIKENNLRVLTLE